MHLKTNKQETKEDREKMGKEKEGKWEGAKNKLGGGAVQNL